MTDLPTQRELVCWVILMVSTLLMCLVNAKGKGRMGFYWVGLLALLLSYLAGVLIVVEV